MKKFISLIILLTIVAIVAVLPSCSGKENNSSKLKITTTIFPPYDFVKQIAGDKAEIKMLVPTGSESHSFEPTLSDLSVIYNSDIFIYAGGDSEEWVNDISEKAKEKGVLTLAMTDCVQTISKNDHEHSNTHTHTEDEIDEHVWTTPKNAILICEKIKTLMCQKDEENSDLYTENFNSYKAMLENLDGKFRSVTQEAHKKTLVFEGRCPFKYFCKEYQLDCYSAIDGCSSNTEVGLATVNDLISAVKKYNLSAVLYIEQSNCEIADAICKSTGAKKLFLHSCHVVSADEFENGISYIKLMENNLETIKEALG